MSQIVSYEFRREIKINYNEACILYNAHSIIVLPSFIIILISANCRSFSHKIVRNNCWLSEKVDRYSLKSHATVSFKTSNIAQSIAFARWPPWLRTAVLLEMPNFASLRYVNSVRQYQRIGIMFPTTPEPPHNEIKIASLKLFPRFWVIRYDDGRRWRRTSEDVGFSVGGERWETVDACSRQPQDERTSTVDRRRLLFTRQAATTAPE